MDGQAQTQQPMAFTDSHNAVYNGLRDTLQRYVAQGIPGMDKIVDALNKQHTSMMGSYQPPQPRPAVATQMNPAQAEQGQVAAVGGLMNQIRQQNQAQLPNGYGGYAS